MIYPCKKCGKYPKLCKKGLVEDQLYPSTYMGYELGDLWLCECYSHISLTTSVEYWNKNYGTINLREE